MVMIVAMEVTGASKGHRQATIDGFVNASTHQSNTYPRPLFPTIYLLGRASEQMRNFDESIEQNLVHVTHVL